MGSSRRCGAAGGNRGEVVGCADLPQHVQVVGGHATAGERFRRKASPEHHAGCIRVARGHAQRERVADQLHVGHRRCRRCGDCGGRGTGHYRRFSRGDRRVRAGRRGAGVIATRSDCDCGRATQKHTTRHRLAEWTRQWTHRASLPCAGRPALHRLRDGSEDGFQVVALGEVDRMVNRVASAAELFHRAAGLGRCV